MNPIRPVLASVTAAPTAPARRPEAGPQDVVGPTAPAPAPKRPRKAAAARLPQEHAVLHRPREGGGAERLLKVPAAELREVEDGFVFLTGSGLCRCDDTGHVRFEADLPADLDVRDVVVHGERVLVLGEDRLLAFDARDGRPVGEAPLAGERGVPRLAPLGGGGVAVTRHESLLVLDDALRTVREEDLGFMPKDPAPLKGGAVALTGGGLDSSLRVLGADGSEIFRADRIRSWTEKVAPDGTLWFAEDTSLPTLWGPMSTGSRAVRLDPSTGEIERFPVGSGLRKLLPLSDGGFVAIGDDGVTHSGSGASLSLRHGEYLDMALVAPDEGSVWVSTRGGQGGLRRLYRMDLEEKRTFWSPPADTVWEGTGLFTPVLAEDGSCLVVREGGVDHLGPDGKLLTTFEDSAAAFAALGGGRRLREGLEGAARQWNFAGDLPEEPAQPGRLGADGTLAFAMEPAGEMPAVTGSGSPLLDFTLTDRVETAFARPDRPPVVATMDALQVGDQRLRAESGDRFTTVLPVTKGKRSFVAAGTAQGDVHWWDPGAGEPLVYNAGSGIRSLHLAPGPQLLARTADGAVLAVDLPRALAKGLETPTPSAPEGIGVVERPDEVVIGDVRLPRQGA